MRGLKALRLLVLSIVVASPLLAHQAQQGQGQQGGPARGGRGGAAGQGGDGRGRGGPDRQRAEQEILLAFAQRFRQVAKLTDAEYTKLLGVNAEIRPQVRELVENERRTRDAMRRQILLDSAANQDSVSFLLSEVLRLGRQRIALTEMEQSKLRAFLTPVQRAKYQAMQEQLLDNIDMMMRGDAGRGGAAGGRRGRGRDGGPGEPASGTQKPSPTGGVKTPPGR